MGLVSDYLGVAIPHCAIKEIRKDAYVGCCFGSRVDLIVARERGRRRGQYRMFIEQGLHVVLVVSIVNDEESYERKGKQEGEDWRTYAIQEHLRCG